MTEEDLKNLWYYVLQVADDDRYLYEVYADNELIYIENTKEKAYDKLMELAKFITKQN